MPSVETKDFGALTSRTSLTKSALSMSAFGTYLPVRTALVGLCDSPTLAPDQNASVKAALQVLYLKYDALGISR